MPMLNLTVNGRAVAVDTAPSTLLVDLLRGPLALTGTHQGCDTAQCGACTVLVNGESVKSCNMLALQAAGTHVTTVEGLATGDAPHPVQQAFINCHGLQCGFCTPGMMMTAACLLARTPRPTEGQIVEALEGNLCRCTGYVNIVNAVKQAGELMAGARA